MIEMKCSINKTQQNSRCRLCGDRDETINHIICECSKLPQNEFKTRYDRVGEVIHRELSKILEFDHTNKQYMHNPESAQKNDLVWFGLVLWHINLCRLFNAKSIFM